MSLRNYIANSTGSKKLSIEFLHHFAVYSQLKFFLKITLPYMTTSYSKFLEQELMSISFPQLRIFEVLTAVDIISMNRISPLKLVIFQSLTSFKCVMKFINNNTAEICLKNFQPTSNDKYEWFMKGWSYILLKIWALLK